MLNNQRNKVLCSLAIIAMFTVTILFVSIPPARAQFIIAGWDYPDEYGQGIVNFEVWGNATGSWMLSTSYAHSDSGGIEWYPNASIKLICNTWFNSTLTGASDVADGKNLQRHSVVVTSSESRGTSVFSQQNFTYIFGEDAIDPPMWYYGYYVVLNFLPVSGVLYTVTVTYEVFY